MNGNNPRSRASGYTAGVERPSAERAITLRGLVGLVLTVLLPPLGLFLLWRYGIFRARGRMLLTTLATVEMTALVVLMTPHQELTPRMPVPAPPALVTPSPTEEVLTALYNSEDLVYQNKLEQVKAAGGTERDLLTEEEKLELANDETEAIYNTIVYSVYGNEAVYYHATKVCRTQTNGRELTVRDALREGLEPCPNCNPPTVDS
jgi:uncharacterized membrane protein YqaE (UPF0057 family)